MIFCGFIVWDTQMIIEKKRRGDGDFIGHSLDLFIDFMQVFRKILILLMQKVNMHYGKFSGHAIVFNFNTYIFYIHLFLHCLSQEKRDQVKNSNVTYTLLMKKKKLNHNDVIIISSLLSILIIHG